MLKTNLAVQTEYITADLQDEVAQICRAIPPLWDLENYVAVNPFLGFTAQPIAEAAGTINDGLGARVFPPVAYYRERWQSGAFGIAELSRAAQAANQEIDALVAILEGRAPVPLRTSGAVLTCAELIDWQHHTNWHALSLRHTTLWCAVHIPQAELRTTGQGLFAAWRATAIHDRSLELHGLSAWRAWVAALPTDPAEVLAALLPQLDLGAGERRAYLYRLLGGVFGWAAYLRRAVWVAGDQTAGPLLDLLAIRLATDLAVAQLAGLSLPQRDRLPPRSVEDESLALIFQTALEDRYAAQLFAALNPPAAAPLARPALQAVFCIDVRSEVIRRHLEAQAPQVETLGFAGFFGVFLNWQTDDAPSARCPVLLQPNLTLRTAATDLPTQSTLKQITQAPASAFTFVETVGLGFALKLLRDFWGGKATTRDEGQIPFNLDPQSGAGLSGAQRIDLAKKILHNLGLRERVARIVLLCGHEAQSCNNPHHAGLECGACGGHGGALNARVAAAILNDSVVRAKLPAHGFHLPSDTYFLPAVHNTATDEVRLLDLERLPLTHRDDLAQLRVWLAAASSQTRRERAGALGLPAANPSWLAQLLGKRAQDWSEVRPEWALARNAAFIAARRQRTRGVDLAGRSFLHEYDWRSDPDNAILTLILTAPLVVASWINLQYLASTVDNDHFGCGTKTLHNRVGNLGVVLGNGGDLRTGLALQSVQHPDGQWYHEPLRLQVIVEAPIARIDAILQAHTHIHDLVECGWLRLFALDPTSQTIRQRITEGEWSMI